MPERIFASGPGPAPLLTTATGKTQKVELRLQARAL